MTSVDAGPNALARQGVFVKLLVVLLFAACAFGQPQVDSVFVFGGMSGFFTDAVALPGGDFIVGGFFFSDTATDWTVMRMNVDREILWQQGIPSEPFFFGTPFMLVDDSLILSIVPQYVQIDSNSGTFSDVAALYTIEGDSLWTRDYDDAVNNTSLSGAAPDGDGGYLLLGYEYVRDGETWNQDVRVIRVDSTGELMWERFFGGELADEPGGILKLDGDSALVSMMVDDGPNDHVALMWLSLDGDSMGGRLYSAMGEATGYERPRFFRRGNGFELVWPGVQSSNSSETFYWLQTDFAGNVEFEYERELPINSLLGLRQAPDGLMTVGYSPWGVQDRDAVIGRINLNGILYYNQPIVLPLWQEAYGYLPNGDGPLTLLGRTNNELQHSTACFFYLSTNIRQSYLFAMPAQVHFGIVPQHDIAVRDISLVVSADSSVTVTDIQIPEYIAISLQPPFTIAAGESLHIEAAFRPDELQVYADTIHVISDALNQDLPIPFTGQAPFPECTPAIPSINFNWAEIGHSVRRPFAVFNTGTLPLHIDQIVQPAPFYLDNPGPFVVEPDTNALLWITFRPDSVMLYEVSLVFQSDDPQGADTVLLRGRGLESHVDANDPVELPSEFKLLAAYPNPFNATAVIRFELPKSELVKLELFDITGRLVKEITRQSFAAGEHRIIVDGAGLASGIYFANLNAGEFHAVQKLVLLK